MIYIITKITVMIKTIVNTKSPS